MHSYDLSDHDLLQREIARLPRQAEVLFPIEAPFLKRHGVSASCRLWELLHHSATPPLHHSTTPIVGAGNTQLWPGLNGREADFLKRQAAVRVLGTSAENLR